ncbi:MAG: hypothetical protein A4E25_01490 [Methanobacterium sp. PtaB.Bin024]|jgi:hypothetical protein|nr:MAG: hypothetical protein A4E25_01490 [Methanobacterium sp. PtaB.Bin024]
MRKPVWILIIITGAISLYCGFYVSTATAFPENPATHTYFDKICEMPFVMTPGPHPETFWQKGGDCDDRARVFKAYLESKGATGVQLCWMCRIENGTMVTTRTGDYSHEFVVWNNRVYNPSHNKSRQFYNVPISEYQTFASKTHGFNTWYFENQTVGTSF